MFQHLVSISYPAAFSFYYIHSFGNTFPTSKISSTHLYFILIFVFLPYYPIIIATYHYLRKYIVKFTSHVAVKFPEWLYCSLIPVYLQLTEKGHLQILPLSSYALSPMMLSMLETFLELLLWNSFSAVTFLVCLQYPEIFIPLKQTLFSETARSHSEPNNGNMVGVPLW
jgi:hypothetical protein